MRAAVLGSPIAHSLSPALHRAAYAALGLDWRYDAFEVGAAELPSFLAGLDADWAGLSLTMPLKEAVIPLLADVDREALAVHAVNTVLPGADGWRGRNTDIDGIVSALREAGASAAATATVIGAGATARSAIAALARIGTRDVRIHARRPEQAADLAALAGAFGLPARAAGFAPEAEALAADVVVCTVPGDAGSPWAPLAGAATGTLLDAAYHPWPTPLAAAWGGRAVASGRDMLLWQAVEQVRLMTGYAAPVAAMRAALPPA